MLRNEDRLYHVVVSFPSVCANQFFIFKFKRNEAICCLIGVGIGISCCLMYRWLRSTFYSLGYLSPHRAAITLPAEDSTTSSSSCVVTNRGSSNCCCHCSCKINPTASLSSSINDLSTTTAPSILAGRRRPPRNKPIGNLYATAAAVHHRYNPIGLKNQNSQSTSSGCSSRAISEQKEMPGFMASDLVSTSRANKRPRPRHNHQHIALEYVQARLACDDLIRMFYRQFQRNYKLRPRFSRRYFRKSLFVVSSLTTAPTATTNRLNVSDFTAIKRKNPVLLVTSTSFATGEEKKSNQPTTNNYANRSRSASLSDSASKTNVVDYNNNNTTDENSFGTVKPNLLLTRLMSDRSDSNHSLSEFGDIGLNDSAFDLTDNMTKASNTSLFPGRPSTVDKSIEEALFHIDKLKEEMSHLCGDLDQLYTKRIVEDLDSAGLSQSTVSLLSHNQHNQQSLSGRVKHPELNEDLIEGLVDSDEQHEFYNMCCSYFDTILNDELTNGGVDKKKNKRLYKAWATNPAKSNKRTNCKNSYNRLFKKRTKRTKLTLDR